MTRTDRMPAGRRGRLLDPVLQGGGPRRRDRRPGARRAGRRTRTAPRCTPTRGGGAHRGGGGGRGSGRRRRGGRRRPAARHGLPGRRRRGGAPGAAVERHPVGRRRRASWSRSCGAARAWAEAVGRCRSPRFTVTKLRWLAEHEPATPPTHRRGVPPARLADLAAGRRPGHRTPDHRPQRRLRHRLLVARTGEYRPDLLERAPRPAGRGAAVLGPPSGRMLEPAASRRPTPRTGGRGARIRSGRRRHRRQRGARRWAWARGPATSWSRSAPPARSSRCADAPDRRPDRRGRRLRRRHRPLPAAGVHAQRRAGAGRGGGAARRQTSRELSRLALSAPAGGRRARRSIPYLEGERTPNRPDATGALHGLRLANSTPAHLARAAVEGMLCGLADGLDALERSRRPGATGAADRRRRAVGGGAGDRAGGAGTAGRGPASPASTSRRAQRGRRRGR